MHDFSDNGNIAGFIYRTVTKTSATVINIAVDKGAWIWYSQTANNIKCNTDQDYTNGGTLKPYRIYALKTS